MKNIFSTTITAIALSMGVNSAIASDFSDDVNDLKASITAIEKQLDSMDVNYSKTSLDTGLNRTQELRALEAQYKDLKTEFSNAYTAN
ncbi:hypothetical protein [Marinomonas sp. PE14-40]|uniref:hypothetical protein n=1 Tax=Marinomonas sp. PE14-40 TaxID=3060621 RepID=UPI003F680C9F